MAKKININALIGEIEASLSSNYTDPVLREQYAWWTLEAITKSDKASLIALRDVELSDQDQEQLKQWLDKMVNENMPIQYLLGSVPFIDLDILVEPPTLIPRPETEEWTVNLIEQLKKLKESHLKILDLCSGSGCISLALGKALPNAMIIAGDISEKAIELGKKNAQHNKISNVTFIHADLYSVTEHIDNPALFDIIVSNPPYISFAEFEELDNSVSSWEDPQALVAQDDGLAIIEDIIEAAPDFIKPNPEMERLKIPQLVVEIGHKQGHKVMDFFKSFGFTDVQVHKDLEGKDRYVTGRLAKV
jgi:release factor glutamine methyltransferase